jgi:hypothetical protein
MPKAVLPSTKPLRDVSQIVQRLLQVWGIRRAPKTVRNDIWQGKVKDVRYVGSRPMLDDPAIDNYARSLIRTTSPLRRKQVSLPIGSIPNPLSRGE